jgi:gas vesicle protein
MAEITKSADLADPARVSNTGQSGSLAQSVADQARSAGRDIKDKAVDLAGASAETIKGHASDFADAAKDFASQTGEKVQQAVSDQKGAGADYVGNLADTMRRAAREFESDLPLAATYIRKAASQVESVSDTVRDGNFSDLVRGAQSFARRQPTAFLGLSVLAGFGMVRFLKSSADAGDESRPVRASVSASQHRGRSSATTSGWDNRGYRDEYTK